MMGILELILVLCLVLKLAGLAFADIGYLQMVGYYVFSWVAFVFTLFTLIGVAEVLGSVWTWMKRQ